MSPSCELTQRTLSARFDGEDVGSPALDEHVAGCDACAAFVAASTAARRDLRIGPVGVVPDLASAVTQRITEERPSRRPTLVVAAAAFLLGLLVTATVLGVGGRTAPVSAGSLPERLLDAQRQIETLSATVTVTELGWHPDVGTRTFAGTLDYRAPESFALRLRDRTAYPSDDWRRADIDVVIDEDAAWTSGVRSCPIKALPTCTPDEPRTAVVTRRAPFDAATPVPLDLAVPATSFRSTTTPTVLEEATVDGREAIAVAVTAAQLEPLLRAFDLTGNLREVHPTDPVRLWLDDAALVPLRVEVRAAGGPDRARWSASHGYDDVQGDTILRIELDDVTVDEPLPTAAFERPSGAATAATDAAFEEGGPVDFVPVPHRLPAGLAPHRSGTVETGEAVIGVRTWSDGLRWLQIRAVSGWDAERLFGTTGDALIPTRTRTGTVYADPAANTVALHADQVDLTVTGNLPLDELIDLAVDLPVTPEPVPDSWPEADAASPTEARAAMPGLELPRSLDGFGPPALRVDDGYVVATYTGPGARTLVLTQGPGDRLPPPLDIDVTGVVVDGGTGRWSPTRGELEWTDDGRVLSLRSSTVPLAELIAITEQLAPA